MVLAMLSAPKGFQHADGEVAEGRHGSWRGPAADGGGVLGEGDVPDVVRGVFHSPVPTNRGGQIGWADLVGVDTGDGVDALAGLALPGPLASAVDASRMWGKAIPPSSFAMEQVLMERDSRRPYPVSEAVCERGCPTMAGPRAGSGRWAGWS